MTALIGGVTVWDRKRVEIQTRGTEVKEGFTVNWLVG